MVRLVDTSTPFRITLDAVGGNPHCWTEALKPSVLVDWNMVDPEG